MSKRKLNIRRQEFKDKILVILENEIDEKTKAKINSCNSKNEIRKVICELTEYHSQLRENGIKSIYPSSKKKKPNLKGAEFDRTINSVKAIYTPMGNKR
ncbi:hypothetical protein E1J38_014850 [Seonamhaeicola sediminis]|uniref:Uncharacterized protein n=1 Tax=Seonamhaeicola sediminis TaxID=2528206 RepID=A0A562Y7J1_9FLAO|nr:hypothetical protein [Seonamhaeicola sediminis]TWO30333.1 hypothetical protein E1J38_014850 [Seonamhaeicola sediminis]